MVAQTIRKGFKPTDLGPIPEDWLVISLGDIINYTKGYGFKSADYKNSGIRILRVSDTNSSAISDKNEIYLDEKYAKQFSNWVLHEDDIVISTVGSKPPMYDSIVGRAVIIDKEHEGILLNQNAVLIQAKKKSKSKQHLLLNQFRTKRYIDYIETIFRGNANQASVTLNDLFNFQLALPTDEDEQSDIAKVLSDTDALIEPLDRLIEKKKNIKQGAMQELLTGKKRLSGFTEEWETRKWNFIADVRDGTHESPKYCNKGIMFVTSKNIINGKLDFTEISLISEEDAIEVNKRSKVDKDDILISMIGTIGNAVLVDFDPDFCIKNIALIKPKKGLIAPEFFIQLIYSGHYQKYLQQKLAGGIQKFISLEILRNLEAVVPPLIDEQIAIAQILSDMDLEIDSLERKRDKYKQLKVGLMQQLLTGRIRLKCLT